MTVDVNLANQSQVAYIQVSLDTARKMSKILLALLGSRDCDRTCAVLSFDRSRHGESHSVHRVCCDTGKSFP